MIVSGIVTKIDTRHGKKHLVHVRLEKVLALCEVSQILYDKSLLLNLYQHGIIGQINRREVFTLLTQAIRS